MAGCCSVLRAFLFEYDTPRIVLIRSRKVGLMNRVVQLLILAYANANFFKGCIKLHPLGKEQHLVPQV
uniref:Purinergic receptor P2x4 subunit variant e n=1 Tax=Mus musculus TaxID=10090 RepID=J9TN51_MOUSE|nr:purinergic receptor P2x4 subunit variant e [Mus musculus]